MMVCLCPPGGCGRLVADATAGDREAGNELASKFYPLAVAIARRAFGANRPEDVEDAVQSAMLKLVRNLGKWRGKCPFCKFAAVVFARRVIEWGRGTQLTVPLADVDPPDHRGPPLDAELPAKISAALNEFPPDWQRAWWLIQDGASQDEAGRAVGKAARTIRVWMAEIRDKLAEVVDIG
jgi:RNA polymerase sigma factor (sigma-70 family)